MTSPPEPRTDLRRQIVKMADGSFQGRMKVNGAQVRLYDSDPDRIADLMGRLVELRHGTRPEAAGAPLREALERRMASGGWDAKTKAAYEWGFTDCMALAATPAPAPLDVEALPDALAIVFADLENTPGPLFGSYWQDRADALLTTLAEIASEVHRLTARAAATEDTE